MTTFAGRKSDGGPSTGSGAMTTTERPVYMLAILGLSDATRVPTAAVPIGPNRVCCCCGLLKGRRLTISCSAAAWTTRSRARAPEGCASSDRGAIYMVSGQTCSTCSCGKAKAPVAATPIKLRGAD